MLATHALYVFRCTFVLKVFKSTLLMLTLFFFFFEHKTKQIRRKNEPFSVVLTLCLSNVTKYGFVITFALYFSFKFSLTSHNVIFIRSLLRRYAHSSYRQIRISLRTPIVIRVKYIET